MRSNLLAIAIGCAAFASCADPEVAKAKREAAARTKIAAESVTAAGAAALPSTGRWDPPHLVERLVSMGLAPQRIDTARARTWMGAPVLAFQLGQATLYAYIYADSLARRAITARLDPLTLAPAGSPGPYGVPHELIQQNNLAAIVVGGTDRQRERIANAIAAGLAAP